MSSNRSYCVRRRPWFKTLGLSLLVVGILSGSHGLLAQQVVNGDGRRFYPDDPLWQDPDELNIEAVSEFGLHKDWDFIENSFGHPGKDPSGPALNINTLGEVPDSSWFANRLGQRDMSVDEVVRGPNEVDGPAPGPWKITGRPWAGITPKFTIRDTRGDTYVVKLDPTHMPELVSTAEVISSKIFHAAGYHVAEYYLVGIDFDQIEVEPGARYFVEGAWRPIRKSNLEYWLRNQPRNPDGTVRAVASRYLPGTHVGEFRHYGTRSDDPNDLFLHQTRRELRGYRVFAAWLNHDDSRGLNTFDSLVEEDGRAFIRHYLLDFGSNLGSGSTNAQEPRAGNEYYMAGGEALKGIFTFGLWSRGWMHVKYPDYPSVGNVEADFFEPQKWVPNYPNAAFQHMDAADAFWAARIVSRFTDEMIHAIVAEARMSDPEAEAYLRGVILERRDKVINYWISRTNPLDEFDIQSDRNGARLSFENAAVRVGAATPGASYSIHWSRLDNLADTEEPYGTETSLDGTSATVPDQAWGSADDVGYRYAVAAISTHHPDHPLWEEPVLVTLRDRHGELDIVGIERPRYDPVPLP